MGEVGRHLAESLAGKRHTLGIIESSNAVAEELEEQLDGYVVRGNGSSVSTLAEAQVAEADLFMALSGDDEANLVGASLAKAMGAKRTIARVSPRVQRDEWLFDVKSHFRIDYLFSTQRLAAVELAKHIRHPEGIWVEEIARGRIEVQQVGVSAGLKVLRKPLHELNLPPRVRIGAILRDERFFVPSAADVVLAGDVLTIFGAPQALAETVRQFQMDTTAKEEASVLIFGGGEYGFSLAQMLEGSQHRVRIMERDAELCRRLSQTLQRTVVIQGDGTSIQQLKQEQVGDADFFVAASEDDEDNVMACLQAKNLGAKYCLVLIHRADYASVIAQNSKQLKIRTAVSPRESAFRELLGYVTTERANTVLKLSERAEVLEAVISESGPLSQTAVADVAWPEGCVLVAQVRGSEAFVPGPGDVMTPGDTVYALVATEAKRAFTHLLQS